MSDPNQPNDQGQPSPNAGVPSGMPGGMPGQTQPVQPKKSGGAGKWVLIIVGVLFLSMVCCGGGIYFTVIKAVEAGKGFVADIFRETMVQAIEDSELPAEQQTALISEIDTLRDEFKAGEITMEQMAFIAEEVTNSPIMPMLTAKAIEGSHINKSGLSDEEKAEASKTIQRVATGVQEGSISSQEIDALVAPLQQQMPDGSTQMKQNITDEELRSVIENAKALADKAGVSEDVPEVDYAKELRAAIDRAKQREPGSGG